MIDIKDNGDLRTKWANQFVASMEERKEKGFAFTATMRLKVHELSIEYDV